MKMLKKSEVVRLKQVEHVNNERQVLAAINHPYIVNLYYYIILGCCKLLI